MTLENPLLLLNTLLDPRLALYTKIALGNPPAMLDTSLSLKIWHITALIALRLALDTELPLENSQVLFDVSVPFDTKLAL